MLRNSNSPTPLLHHEDPEAGPVKLSAAAHVTVARQQASLVAHPHGTPTKRRPAPLKLRSPVAAPHSAAPLVVEDDSKPELSDLGMGLQQTAYLRLPGLPV